MLVDQALTEEIVEEVEKQAMRSAFGRHVAIPTFHTCEANVYLFVRDDVSQPGPHAVLGRTDAEGGKGLGGVGGCKFANLPRPEGFRSLT